MSLLVILSTCVMEDGQTATSVPHHHSRDHDQKGRRPRSDATKWDLAIDALKIGLGMLSISNVLSKVFFWGNF